jgi:hypothetical protein
MRKRNIWLLVISFILGYIAENAISDTIIKVTQQLVPNNGLAQAIVNFLTYLGCVAGIYGILYLLFGRGSDNSVE